jgi:demethylmenaquinone methyltransferase/2-methoxy-6-polyprenyl-1,4-benzoquinol methylase
MALSEKSTPGEFNSSTSWNADLLQNPHAVEDKRRRVQQMFAAIAPSYDLNNRLHSLWMDQAWRRKAVKLAGLKATDRVVDVACGTGDLTLTFEMLPLASDKASHFFAPIRSHPRPTFLSRCIRWMNGDAQCLPLPDKVADVISIAFGIRNVQEPAKALSEFRRVLRPGGRLIILEFSLPTNRILRSLYNFYFRQVLPRTATLISGDKTGAYKYLPESVNTFIGRNEMMAMMREAGFEQVEQFPMTFGVCVCYRGVVGG